MERADFENMAPRLRPAIVAGLRRYVPSADDADDIAQDTLLRLWQMRQRLEDYRSVEALARMVARNLAIDMLRRRRPTVSLDDDSAPHPFPDAESPPADVAAMAADEERETDRILSRLSPSQRAVVRMKHIEGLEVAEIARILDATENNVRVLLFRARANIKKMMLDNE